MAREKNTADTKRSWLVLRVTPAERAAVSAAARAAGLTMSAYVLRRCVPRGR